MVSKNLSGVSVCFRLPKLIDLADCSFFATNAAIDTSCYINSNQLPTSSRVVAHFEGPRNISLLPDETRVVSVYYTSGSTGVPKGCIMHAHAIRNYCLSRNRVHEIGESNRKSALQDFDDSHSISH